ncbi:MAG: YIP1 family protein [bacterium]|nr:YIP1 family protein [bacterium]
MTLPPEQDPPPAEPPNSVPFEDESTPFLARFAETVKLALGNPQQLFSGLRGDDIGPPVLYGLIVVFIGSIFAAIWQVAWNMFFGGLAMLGGDAALGQVALSTGGTIVWLFLGPVVAVACMFLLSGAYHLLLMLFGGADRGFGITLRAVAYGGTPWLFNIVPCLGFPLAVVWCAVLVVYGACLGHRTDWWRATLAFAVLAGLCCCTPFGLLFVLVSLGATAL